MLEAGKSWKGRDGHGLFTNAQVPGLCATIIMIGFKVTMATMSLAEWTAHGSWAGPRGLIVRRLPLPPGSIESAKSLTLPIYAESYSWDQRGTHGV
jgi:hypothetical protein